MNSGMAWTTADSSTFSFIVTNMAQSAENVVDFYNKRGTCEQWALSPPTPSVSSFMRGL